MCTEAFNVARPAGQWGGIGTGEEILILSDYDSDFSAVKLMAATARMLGGKPTIVMEPTPEKQEASEIAAEAIKGADSLFNCSTRTMLHHDSIQAALKEREIPVNYLGVGPGADLATFVAQAEVYRSEESIKAVEKLDEKLLSVMRAGKRIRVTSPIGTDLTAELGQKMGALSWEKKRRGRVGEFPLGEAPVAPAMGTAEGVVVVDGSMQLLGLLKEPMKWIVRDGKVREIQGGLEAERLRKIIAGVENAENIGEIGIGTNPGCRLTGYCVNEDKRGLGRVHIAMGSNVWSGLDGRSQLHLDAVLMSPSVEIDGKKILENGIIRV